MKKLLMSVFLVMGMMLPYAAMADGTPDELKWCAETYDPGKKVPRAVIYFANGKFTIDDKCNGKVLEVINRLANDAESIQSIVLAGSTDRTASNDYNYNLSKKRIDTVKAMLAKNGALKSKLCTEEDTECMQELALGEATSAAIYNMKDNTREESARAVFIFVVYKRLTCSQQLHDLLSTVDNAMFKEGDVCDDAKRGLKNVKHYCSSVGQALSTEINTAIMAALEKTVPCLTEPDVIQNITNTVKITFNLTAVSDAYNRLQQMRRDFDVTVWKTEDGKFNTSRLISDSVAGVVLGTTGALVTSKLVKKSQIKNGFEDIQCTIGGQGVANWGDEFVVGMQ